MRTLNHGKTFAVCYISASLPFFKGYDEWHKYVINGVDMIDRKLSEEECRLSDVPDDKHKMGRISLVSRQPSKRPPVWQ